MPSAPSRHRIQAIPNWIWAPLATAVLVAIPGFIGWLSGYVWLFPSLGPTAYVQATEPNQRTSRLYHILMGHAVGIGAAYLFVAVFPTWNEPPALASGHLYPNRVWASIAAIALTLLVQVPLKALHAPSAANVLLITLGGFEARWRDVFSLAVGVGIVAFTGDILRHLRAAKP